MSMMHHQNRNKNVWNKYFDSHNEMKMTKPLHYLVQVLPKNSNKQIKILSLGTGSSGKATIFKQLKYIHNDSCNHKKDDTGTCGDCNLDNNNEYKESIHVIRQNCVAGMLTILRKSQELYDENPELYGKCLVNMDDQTVADIQLIVNYGSESFSEALDYIQVTESGKAINR
eukprot:481957_1